MRIGDDGILRVHQSDIKSFMTCPEQVRLKLTVDDDSHFESDAATVGTCLHAVIENELQGDHPYKTLKEARKWGAEYFVAKLGEYAAQGNTVYSRESFGTDIKALRQLEMLVESWYYSDERSMLLHVDPNLMMTEWSFDIPFTNVEGLQVNLAGQADLVLLDQNEVWDWKSASSEYKRWEYQRWSPQPTVYTWAAAQDGLIVPDAEGLFDFRFKVFVRGEKNTVQTVDITRSQGHFDWMEQVVINMVHMFVNLPDGPWPLNDNHVLCSPKWCPFWASCKGKHINASRGWL